MYKVGWPVRLVKQSQIGLMILFWEPNWEPRKFRCRLSSGLVIWRGEWLETPVAMTLPWRSLEHEEYFFYSTTRISSTFYRSPRWSQDRWNPWGVHLLKRA